MKAHRSERIYEGRVLNLRVDEIDTYAGDGRRRVEVVEHPGGVAIVAQPTPRTIVLVRQHRHAVDGDLWEIPAGMIERGEDPAQTARRELIEETGYRTTRLWPIFSLYSSPGFSSERIRLYVAEGLSEGVAEPEEDERFEIRVWELDEAWSLVERDELRDAKTQIGLAWARERRASG